jgi:hypothetical protein
MKFPCAANPIIISNVKIRRYGHDALLHYIILVIIEENCVMIDKIHLLGGLCER